MEAWARLHGAIFDKGLEVDCHPIIFWICVILSLETGNNKSPLDMLHSTVPLTNGYLLRHQNHMLNRHLLGMDPAIQRVQGLLITIHTGDVAVEMRRDREAKAMSRQADEEKEITDLLGYKLT